MLHGCTQEYGDIYTNRKQLVFCRAHRREVCHECCMDHRPTNEVRRGGDFDAVMQWHQKVQRAETEAMYTAFKQ